MSRTLEAVAFAAIVTLLSPILRGQEKTFQVQGRVDTDGRPLDMWIRAEWTGDIRTTVADETGAFSFQGLPPGHYKLQGGQVPVTVPPTPYLYVDLQIDRDLTLLLRTGSDHYFCLLDPTSDRALAKLSGSAKNRRGAPIEGATVTLYVPKLGRIATTHTDSGGSFSFAGLKIEKNYWIQVVADGYFIGELNKLEVLAGYETIVESLTLEACDSGHCDSSSRQIPIYGYR